MNCAVLTGLFFLSGCNSSSDAFGTTPIQQGSSSDAPPTVAPAPTNSPIIATPTKPTLPARGSSAGNIKVCGSEKFQGVDVSDYDPNTQWSVVQHSGVGFAFIKATEGLTYTNPYFAGDWTGTQAAGMLRGAYHFFHPADDPTAQAQLYLRTLGSLGPQDLPPMLDWEVSDGVSAAVQISKAKIWLQLVEAATGRVPVLYIGPAYWNSLGNPQGFDQYPLFIADYGVDCPVVPPPWNTWTFWQTGTGPQIGIQTKSADLDLFNGTASDLLQFTE